MHRISRRPGRQRRRHPLRPEMAFRPSDLVGDTIAACGRRILTHRANACRTVFAADPVPARPAPDPPDEPAGRGARWHGFADHQVEGRAGRVLLRPLGDALTTVHLLRAR